MTADRPPSPLLTVKRVIPPARAGSVPRDRLVRLLSAATTPLTVVVAPAGWGKTSLLSSWAAQERGGVAWVSLDEGDDEPTRFWRYVLSALHGVGDEISGAALDALAAPGVDPLDLALPILLNELAGAAAPHVLVLDDYHVLTDPRIHEGVEFLLTYLPAASRLVLSGRADPPLRLARLRARAQLTELRAADLRFSPDEAAALVSAVAGTTVDGAVVARAWDRSEGWAAGLQLAALAMRGRPDPAAVVRGDDRHVRDYVTAEVLPALAPAQRDLLVRAAPLDRVSGALCDAALQVTGSADVLDELERADLFVVALDECRTWFRCHHLLREVLLGEPRAADDTPVVLRRAAAWFEQQGGIDDAARLLLQVGDAHAAAALLESAEAWFLDRGAAATYLQLGERLPSAAVGPRLALSTAYAAAVSGRLDRVPHWLDRCDERLTSDTVVPGWCAPRAAALMMRAVVGLPDAESAHAVALCRHAVDLETEAGGAGLSVAVGALGSALARNGDFAEAVELLRETWRRRTTIGWSIGVTLQIGGNLGLSLLELGRGAELDAFLREAGPLCDDAERRWGPGAGPVVAMLRLVHGRRCYGHGDPADARTLLGRAVTLAEVAALPTTLVLALVFLADAELGCGDRAAARAALARAREHTDDEPVTPFAMRKLDEAQTRIGRVAARSAVRSGVLAEELTDRELSVLRMLPGPATRREIGGALHLSVNTVKAYTASLYRKRGVASRQDAVASGRRLGLI